ncbi:MAG: ATP-dependent protease ATPase subunit HslU [Armatimonadetes bacterium]|nr:ATP-dependent protease ATPase subunit HslU [Armatimonadota bacterium]
MSLPIEDLTPRQIVAELDRYIVGQDAAKRAVAVALRNRQRRQRVSPEERDDIVPKNILMIGPTGVGKTEIARRLAQLARAPFVKVEATKFTEVGYVGRDVDSMIRELVGNAVRLVEAEHLAAIRPAAQEAAVDEIVRLLDEQDHPDDANLSWSPLPFFGHAVEDDGEHDSEELRARAEQREAERDERRAKLADEVRQGVYDRRTVEVEVEEPQNNFLQVFTPQGMEEMGLEGLPMGGGTRRFTRKVTVAEAKEILVEVEAKRQTDTVAVNREAVYRTEQTGIVFVDEIDKVAMKGGGSGPEVSREGVQRDLLPVIEGCTVQSKFGPVRTDHVLFICAGAFHVSKPSDLIPELQGRLPIRVELEALTQDDFRRILKEPKNALTKQYRLLLQTEGVELEFTDDALDELALMAAAVNEKTENIGARRLHTMLEKLLEDEMFAAPDGSPRKVVVDRMMVQIRLSGLVDDPDRNRRIL